MSTWLRWVFGMALAVLWSSAVSAQTLNIDFPVETRWGASAPASQKSNGGPPLVPIQPVTTQPGASWGPATATPGVVQPFRPPSKPGIDPSSYTVVGPGDQMVITVFGQPDLSAEVTVNDNGQVTLPLIGNIRVADLAPNAVEALVAKRLREGEYLRNPEVSVQVKQFRSQMVSVLGEVQRPGRYPLQGRLTVLDLLATAGGLTQRADRTAYLLRRNHSGSGEGERQQIPIRLDQVAEPVRGQLDMELANDDVVVVGQQKLFYVHGEVRKPGAYPLEPDLTVMRALSISGGVTERGSLRRIRIHRGEDKSQAAQGNKVELTETIQGGDVIYVDERIF